MHLHSYPLKHITLPYADVSNLLLLDPIGSQYIRAISVTMFICLFINRPGVAGAVLQTPLSLID